MGHGPRSGPKRSDMGFTWPEQLGSRPKWPGSRPIIGRAWRTETSEKMIWCPKDRAHQIMEKDMPEHMMIEGFRWSVGHLESAKRWK